MRVEPLPAAVAPAVAHRIHHAEVLSVVASTVLPNHHTSRTTLLLGAVGPVAPRTCGFSRTSDVAGIQVVRVQLLPATRGFPVARSATQTLTRQGFKEKIK